MRFFDSLKIKMAESILSPSTTIDDGPGADRRADVSDSQPFLELRTFNSSPDSVLGQAIIVQAPSPGSTVHLQQAESVFTAVPVTGYEIDPTSKLRAPLLRASLIVTKSAILKSKAFDYLTAEATADSIFSVMVTDRASGRVNQQKGSWAEAIKQWKVTHLPELVEHDPEFVYVVTGYVQKEIVRKKFKKLTAGGKGGAFAVSVDGQMHTSNEEYFLDHRFGLEAVPVYQRPRVKTEAMQAFTSSPGGSGDRSTRGVPDDGDKPLQDPMIFFATMRAIRQAKPLTNPLE